MKKLENKQSDQSEETVKTGPKFRNLNDGATAANVPEEKPANADIRLRIGVIAIAVFIIIIGVKGMITKSSLSSQLENQNKLLEEAKAEALLYGITEDEDGDLIIPVVQNDPVDAAELDWDSIETRNNEILKSLSELLLKWDSPEAYETNRKILMERWNFDEDSALLSNFMPAYEEDSEYALSMYFEYDKSPKEVFVLSNDSKNMSYFVICTVRKSANDKSSKSAGSKSVEGTVGLRISINEDGTISNVSASTIQ